MTARTKSAYHHVHSQITNGTLAPGDVISEAAIAKELGCSRTPIGEALRRLAEDGLVQQIPRYGTIVRDIPAEELLELFEVREALEVFAIQKGAERIRQETLRDMKALCGKIDQEVAQARQAGKTSLEGESLRCFLAADMAFHLLIIAAAGNKKLLKVAQRTGTVAHVFQARRGNHTLERAETANHGHKAIVEALENKDAKLAVELLTNHIRISSQISTIDELSDNSDRASLSGLDLPAFLLSDLTFE
ncbi:MAG: GntR family transcriptional regulator [Planctomycetales bacterium]|nr:GntR family transcriptional regulator [Planctomycetales bacterium]